MMVFVYNAIVFKIHSFLLRVFPLKIGSMESYSKNSLIKRICFIVLLFLAGCDSRIEKKNTIESGREPKVITGRMGRNELVPLTSTHLESPLRLLTDYDWREQLRVSLELEKKEEASESTVTTSVSAKDLERSEGLNDLITQQFYKIAMLLTGGGEQWEEVVSPDFRSSNLWPINLKKTYQGGGVSVQEGRITQDQANKHTGINGLKDALAPLVQRFELKTLKISLKTVGITLSKDQSGRVQTQTLVEMKGRQYSRLGNLQIHSTWDCQWDITKAQPSMLPKLISVSTVDYQEATLLRPQNQPPFLFEDATDRVFQRDPLFKQQQLKGIEYWSGRITKFGDMSLTGHHGMAFGDVNHDGLEDLYICDAGSLPNRLYLKQRDGTLNDASRDWEVDWFEDSRGALLIDLDNDGDQDLVVATIAAVVFAENLFIDEQSSPKFVIRGGYAGAPNAFSLSAADYDNDSDLDIYVCVYGAEPTAGGRRGFSGNSPVPIQDANNGGRNVLLENFGSFHFADVTDEVGLNKNNTRWSFASAWEDFDQDGDVDLYVANDFGRNCFYKNESKPGGARKFVEIAEQVGLEDMASGMSVSWGDYNRDGRRDLYVGNMFSAAGHRVSYQRNFAEGRSEVDVSNLKRMARGNSLFSANSDSTKFSDVSLSTNVTQGRWAWSSAFTDINNDGWEDLIVSNGYMTNSNSGDL